jgi:sulfate-transporting ATPase
VAAQFIYTMQKVSRFYPPDREVLKDISLSFFPGAKIGVLGNNGSGKSSLLSIMAGQDLDHDGEAKLTDGFTVGLLEQEPVLNLEKNVLENVMEGVGDVASLLSRYDDILASWSDPEADFEKLGEQQAEVERLIESAGAWDLQRNIEIAMDALRLPSGESDVNVLSGGERRRVALCKLLLSKPDLLLLDEPTNHLDAESVSWLERTLQDYSGTVVAVTHDRYFLDNVAGWILELDRGRGIPYEGNYSGWLDQKSARLDAEEKTDSSRKRTLERELEWIRMAPKARQAKGKARLASYDKLIAEANETEKRDAELQIQIPANSRLGDQVIEVENLSKGFEDRLLIEDLSFSLPPAGIVGIVGGNGAGKTTLFKMLVAAFQNSESGEDLPDSGLIRIGSTVELGYVDQSRDSLDPDRTVYQEITGDKEFISVGNREVNGRAYVASFNFRGSDQQKKVGDLSGGERNRVHLAKVLKTGSNVLLLDEPTNDLDVDTLRALESGLEAFPGCAVIISHDRWFLDRIATHVLAFEGNSYVRWFEGNFSEYEEVKRRESGGENVPTRVQYKPLSRD